MPTYPNLEPNHEVEIDPDGYQLVRCPFIEERTSWAPNAEPDEVNCLFCEHLNGEYPLSPDHGHGDAFSHTEPPIGGGAHGSAHSVTEWQPCRVPLRRITFGDAALVVHDGAVAAIQRIEKRWKAKGGNAAYRIRKADTGAYNCRKTTSGSSWSKHSWGAAVDINWQTNPYGTQLKTDMPRWFIDLWKAEGFGWGGDWKRVKDAMHFSLFVNEGGSGKVYAGSEEDEMTEEQWKEFAETVPIDFGEGLGVRTLAHAMKGLYQEVNSVEERLADIKAGIDKLLAGG